jgi:xylono-1,5-lactonase
MTFFSGEPVCVWPAQAILGEGTVWSARHQSLFWVDIYGCKLHQYNPKTLEKKSWLLEHQITAVTERADSPKLLVSLRRHLAFFDLQSGELELLVEPEAGTYAKNRFNDGKCDAMGNFWCGTMNDDQDAASGSFYVYTPEQSIECKTEGYVVTNGPCWSLDNKTMFMSASAEARIYAFDYDIQTRAISNKRIWLAFADGDGYPDGMTVDKAGRLWVAHWAGGCVTCHAPVTANELARIKLPTSNVTNCAFGGEDMSTLFITTARSELSEELLASQPHAGDLFCVNMNHPGQPANNFQG